jgi:hypothetical protein
MQLKATIYLSQLELIAHAAVDVGSRHAAVDVGNIRHVIMT